MRSNIYLVTEHEAQRKAEALARFNATANARTTASLERGAFWAGFITASVMAAALFFGWIAFVVKP